jgi:hypothetical protein
MLLIVVEVDPAKFQQAKLSCLFKLEGHSLFIHLMAKTSLQLQQYSSSRSKAMVGTNLCSVLGQQLLSISLRTGGSLDHQFWFQVSKL